MNSPDVEEEDDELEEEDVEVVVVVDPEELRRDAKGVGLGLKLLVVFFSIEDWKLPDVGFF